MSIAQFNDLVTLAEAILDSSMATEIVRIKNSWGGYNDSTYDADEVTVEFSPYPDQDQFDFIPEVRRLERKADGLFNGILNDFDMEGNGDGGGDYLTIEVTRTGAELIFGDEWDGQAHFNDYKMARDQWRDRLEEARNED